MNTALTELLDTSTTIAAVSTAPGVGGIAVVRLSGPDAFKIADTVWKGRKLSEATTHTVHLGTVLDTRRQPLDQAVAAVFKGPSSFTGQDTVEFSVHGSTYIQRELLHSLMTAGAKSARPGEFTRRAFVAGKMSLTQAEAIADMISSTSRAAHRMAMNQHNGDFANRIEQLRSQLINLVSLLELELDFSEEDVLFADRSQLRQNATDILAHINHLIGTYGNATLIKNGIPVALTGPTNAGKSSLLNALVRYDRAIVSDVEGTTRDTVEATAEIGDYLFRFVDTAGLRQTDDPIEKMGIERSEKAVSAATIVLSVIDAHSPEAGLKYADKIRDRLTDSQIQIIVYNKTDLDTTGVQLPEGAIATSAVAKDGTTRLVEALLKAVKERIDSDAQSDAIVTNARHKEQLQKAAEATQNVLKALDDGLTSDIISIEARHVVDALSELTGEVTNETILSTIFSKFCIGK